MEYINEPIERDNDIENRSTKSLWNNVNRMLNTYPDDVIWNNKEFLDDYNELKRRGEID